jgi:magnesium chelatase subunit I
VLRVWRERLAGADVGQMLRRFEERNLVVTTGPLTTPDELLGQFGETVDGLVEWADALEVVGSDPGMMASVVEFVLEGLHLGRRLSKDADGPGRSSDVAFRV